MKPSFKEDKATQAAAFFLKKRNAPMSHLKLIKLLYLAEREALIRLGRPITFDFYVSMDHGPVLSETLNLLHGESEGDGSWVGTISAPSNHEINLLKEIKQLGSEIWKKLHIISELKIHNRPQLLNIAIQIASILSSAENAFFWPFSNFYEELKLSYLQIEGELSGLLQVNEDEQFNFKKKVEQVRILE